MGLEVTGWRSVVIQGEWTASRRAPRGGSCRSFGMCSCVFLPYPRPHRDRGMTTLARQDVGSLLEFRRDVACPGCISI